VSVARNQARIARDLWRRLQPLDRGTPARLQGLLADRRFGSRDRRLYRELLVTAIRHARPLAGLCDAEDEAWAAHLAPACAANPDTALFREAFAAAASAAPCEALAKERHTTTPALDLVPEWFADEVDTGQPAATVAAALLTRAPLWVRLQTTDSSTVFAEWAALNWTAVPHPTLPDAWRLPAETPVTSSLAYEAGHYEVQDLGSQLILASLGLKPSSAPPLRWLDACAGAGGKTLQLARLLGPSARVDATDIRPAALNELRARATRAGLRNIRTLPHLNSADLGNYDGVLVDAPCTGSGTWRRSPHLMACTTLADLDEAAALQGRLLADFARYVRPGGLLVYATCSVFRRENRAVTAAFLAAHAADFVAEPPAHDFGFPPLADGPAGLAITPGFHDNDAFYVATFRRRPAGTTL
jgi:16S rRNA (cytosine967-C5)-methyltransferase